MPNRKWALILGASSGFGEAISLALARAGRNVFGVHLDRRATLANVDRIRSEIAAAGGKAVFFNVNAADAERRAEVVAEMQRILAEEGDPAGVDVLVHSLAFGTLKPFVAGAAADCITRVQMDMTLDVMAHSLVYWTQDLYSLGLLSETRIYALTSEGSTRVIPSYGAVSAAKSALESNCRQLAMELARAGTGCSVNAIRAGVTITPALLRIPHHSVVIRRTEKRNPSGRMTTPQDVGEAIVKLSEDGLLWMTGNVISVDGGEFITGS